MKLLEILNSLHCAGSQALHDTLGLTAADCRISLLRQRNLTFNHLIAMKISGSILQKIHLGCDETLQPHLDDVAEKLAGDFFGRLMKELDERNPQLQVSRLNGGEAVLHTRGVRTFEFRLTTDKGQYFYLVEVPSRVEVELARGSEYIESMEAIYLPANWRQCDRIDDENAVMDVLRFLNKVEGDVYLEVPAGDGTATVNSGLVLDSALLEDDQTVKLCTDFSDPALGVPVVGDLVAASVGLGDRSLEFSLEYLGVAEHPLAGGVELPCALFAIPAAITIGQRRRSFRVPVPAPLEVELACALGQGLSAPWSDGDSIATVVPGRLVDLSFSGARIMADHEHLLSCFQKGSRVVCRIHFADQGQTVSLLGVVRRATAGLKDRHQWRDELGLEFLVSADTDRAALDFVRQYVLEIQRSNLAQRIRLAGV
jgi:hypothetical protein